VIETESRTGAESFEVRTLHSDTYRANLRATGRLDLASAPLLAEVISGHLRNRRRFIRLEVAELHLADAAAVATLERLHRQLLAARGTLILTGVLPAFERVLIAAGVAGELFTLPPPAAEVHLAASAPN
jgi:anti-anti-sigma regulatory factor